MVVHVGAALPHPAPPGVRDAAGELDAEVARLLRVRGGELVEPLLWRRPSHRGEVEAILRQLAPIRSRLGLLSSFQREAQRSSPIRLAYAIAWVRLAQRRSRTYGARLRPVYPKITPNSTANR